MEINKENKKLNTVFREGNVVLYIRERSKKFQARLKMENDKWKRISTGESNLKKASLIDQTPLFIPDLGFSFHRS